MHHNDHIGQYIDDDDDDEVGCTIIILCQNKQTSSERR